MKKQILMLGCLIGLFTCYQALDKNQKKTFMTKEINPELPTIGILIFEGFLANEIVAPMDVFTKHDVAGQQLFNVVLLSKENKTYVSEEGLQIIPDRMISEAPMLNVLVVPSSFRPDVQVADTVLIDFIREQNRTTDYIASHCAGAFMLGEAGIADGKHMVTYVSGADQLQQDYPKLLVMDDEENAVVKDGKIFSSNGSLVSYLASLDLLEEMTSLAHRKKVENDLLINKLK